MLGPLGLVSATWLHDYNVVWVGVSALECGDGTQILAAGFYFTYLQKQGTSGVLRIMLGVIVGALLVPTVDISIGVGINALGIPKHYLHLVSAFIMASLSWMALMGAMGKDIKWWWTRKVDSWKASIFAIGSAAAQIAILFFLVEIFDKTGIGTIGFEVYGMSTSANYAGSANGLIAVNILTGAVVLVVGQLLEKWVAWFGYVSAALFAGGAAYALFEFLNRT
jgi:hypothetical protein